MTAPQEPEHWSVSVARNGEQIVTIESNCLSGRDITDEDADTIRLAARHLLSFVGEDKAALTHAIEALRGETLERQHELTMRAEELGGDAIFFSKAGIYEEIAIKLAAILRASEQR